MSAPSSSSSRRVLHVIGSTNDRFMFQVSWLYAKNCPMDLLKEPVEQAEGERPDEKENSPIYDYAVFVPSENGGKQVHWYFIANGHSVVQSMDENWLFGGKVRDPRLPKEAQGPMTTGAMMTMLEEKNKGEPSEKPYDLMVPHCFCYQGMTLYRQLFEDMCGIPHPGPIGLSNAICQSKALTRDVLANVAGVSIPKGETLMMGAGAWKKLANQPAVKEADELIPRPQLPLPYVVKPAAEDNSRGVSLCRDDADVFPALLKAFQYGPEVVVEEFIPGREVRAGAIEGGVGGPSSEDGSNLHVMSCKMEYLMMSADCPIRREEDKLTAQPTAPPAASTQPGKPEAEPAVEEAKKIGAEKVVAGSVTNISDADTESLEAIESSSSTASDCEKNDEKIEEAANETKLVQTKCERAFLLPGADSVAGAKPLAPATIEKIDAAVKAAHRALYCRDYSLFDFRIHAETGEPYIIESCSFWTFTPISAISLLLDRSEEYFDEAKSKTNPETGEIHQVGAWRPVAKELWERTVERGR